MASLLTAGMQGPRNQVPRKATAQTPAPYFDLQQLHNAWSYCSSLDCADSLLSTSLTCRG